jgi:hypothetical protein
MQSVEAGRTHFVFRIWHCTAAIAVVFLALHLPFLPASLEDLDSINFALGVRDFDVARHQPHPPGYPLYIAAGKAVRAVVADEARALSIVGIAAGAGRLRLWRCSPDRRRLPRPHVAARRDAPLHWLTSRGPERRPALPRGCRSGPDAIGDDGCGTTAAGSSALVIGIRSWPPG